MVSWYKKDLHWKERIFCPIPMKVLFLLYAANAYRIVMTHHTPAPAGTTPFQLEDSVSSCYLFVKHYFASSTNSSISFANASILCSQNSFFVISMSAIAATSSQVRTGVSCSRF